MKTIIKHELLDYKEIIIDESYWSGKLNVSIDGKVLESLGKNKFLYTDEENEKHEVVFVGSYIKGLVMKYKGQEIEIHRKFKVYEYILIGIPLLLAILGGLVGGLVGGIASSILFVIMRKTNNIVIKLASSVVISGIAFLIWDLLVTVILNSIE